MGVNFSLVLVILSGLVGIAYGVINIKSTDRYEKVYKKGIIVNKKYDKKTEETSFDIITDLGKSKRKDSLVQSVRYYGDCSSVNIGDTVKISLIATEKGYIVEIINKHLESPEESIKVIKYATLKLSAALMCISIANIIFTIG